MGDFEAPTGVQLRRRACYFGGRSGFRPIGPAMLRLAKRGRCEGLHQVGWRDPHRSQTREHCLKRTLFLPVSASAPARRRSLWSEERVATERLYTVVATLPVAITKPVATHPHGQEGLTGNWSTPFESRCATSSLSERYELLGLRRRCSLESAVCRPSGCWSSRGPVSQYGHGSSFQAPPTVQRSREPLRPADPRVGCSWRSAIGRAESGRRASEWYGAVMRTTFRWLYSRPGRSQ
jgi:hypothetical protein